MSEDETTMISKYRETPGSHEDLEKYKVQVKHEIRKGRQARVHFVCRGQLGIEALDLLPHGLRGKQLSL